jgi:hypothetical protein
VMSCHHVSTRGQSKSRFVPNTYWFVVQKETEGFLEKVICPFKPLPMAMVGPDASFQIPACGQVQQDSDWLWAVIANGNSPRLLCHIRGHQCGHTVPYPEHTTHPGQYNWDESSPTLPLVFLLLRGICISQQLQLGTNWFWLELKNDRLQLLVFP